MTNETTASQPNSIGDDAQFRSLMNAWDGSEHGADADRIYDEIAAYVDCRASAAQASANIQAAPDDAQILKIAAEQDYGDEDPKCIIRLARALFAAPLADKTGGGE